MGDLVEGIGDEVLLFGVFLVFSVCVVLFVNFWRERENHQRQGQSTQTRGEATHQDGGDTPARATDNTSSTQPSSQAQTAEGSQLRSRLGHSTTQSTGSGRQSSARDESRQPESEQGHSPQCEEEGEGESLITIRLIMYGSTTRPVSVSATSTLAEMRRAHFSRELSENRPVKFIYQGRVLNSDSATLQELNITNDCPVHVHIGRPRDNPQQRAQNEQQHVNEFLDLSRFFVPLFGAILGIAWVALFCYPAIFTFITKLFLFFLSIGYFLLAYLTSFA